MTSESAGRAQEPQNKLVQPVPADRPDGLSASIPVDDIQLAVARLYGQGYSRKRICAILLDHLAPKEREGKRDRTKEEQQSLARTKLRRWETNQAFRDLVYEHAVVQLDMSTPEILQGVSRRAKGGRVDAARLALEVTGRHNPKGDQNPPNITVNIANIPRPGGG